MWASILIYYWVRSHDDFERVLRVKVEFGHLHREEALVVYCGIRFCRFPTVERKSPSRIRTVSILYGIDCREMEPYIYY